MKTALLCLVPLALLPSCVVYSSDLLDAEAQTASGGSPWATGGAEVASSGGAVGNPTVPGSGASPSAGGQPASGGAPGSGSASGTGSAPATGGAPSVECISASAEQIIADFETGEAIAYPGAGRSGNWFLFNDGAGTQTPVKPASGPFSAEPGGACGSLYTLRTTGTDFLKWGAGVGVDLLPKSNNVRVPQDLSAYSGFSFQARAMPPTTIRISWADQGTGAEGGVCDPAAGSGEENRCGDYFGIEIVANGEWQSYSFSFSELRQRGFGLPIPGGMDTSAVYSFRAQVGASASFDFSIDEIVLLP